MHDSDAIPVPRPCTHFDRRTTVTTNRHSNLPDDDSGPLEPMDRPEFLARISDYVAGRLVDPEQARFEETLLANPDWAELVAAERLLRAGIRDLARSEPGLFDGARRPK